MTNFGSDVSRTLNAINRQFSNTVFRRGTPFLDADGNFISQIDRESHREFVQGLMPSGFLLDPTMALQDYQFDPSWSNQFVLGNPRITGSSIEVNPVVWANVNGWMIPVAGTDITAAWETARGETTNIVRLNPPPESDARIDLVFLEVWQARVNANPSTVNKPSNSTIWKYGNVKFGGTNLPDDIEDPNIGYSVTARVQVQYRIRVFGSGSGAGQSADLVNYPDGLGYPNILGQATATSPVGGYPFINMRQEMGDPSLWRAGDGNVNNGMGTVDGYSYAIPICAVFRRNSGTYVAVAASGNPNHNGAFNRTPSTMLLPNPVSGAKELTTATLTSTVLASDGFSALAPAVTPGAATVAYPYGNPVAFDIAVTGLSGSGLDDPNHDWTQTYIQIGSEIFGVTSVNTVANTITIPVSGRGRFGTAVTEHVAGTEIQFFNARPDNAFSDQVLATDVLDLRHGINATDWDYGRLLEHNVGQLLTGKLRSTWKREGSAFGGTQGPVVHEVDHLYAFDTTHPNGTEPVDGPDGCRYVWSDAAAIQPDVNCLLDNEADTSGATPQTVESFDASVEWDVAPGFKPSGFMNTQGLSTTTAFSNGCVMLFHIGGETGGGGARGTFRDGNTRAVRFLMPKEQWKSGYPIIDPNNGNQYPIKLRFWGEKAFEPAPENLIAARAARHVGPMYPWKDLSFEYPFIALGGILSASGNLMRLQVPNTAYAAATDYDASVFSDYTIMNLDVNSYDFDVPNSFANWENTVPTGSKKFTNDPTLVTNSLMRGERTLYGLLTDDGRDLTGLSSELYLVVYGDDQWRHNNGAFQVIGAGTIGYTTNNGLTSTSLVLRPLSADYVIPTGSEAAATLMVEFRTPYHNSDDASSSTARIADLAIVLTDVGGELDKSITVGGMTISTGDHLWKKEYLGYGDATYDLSLPVDGGTANARTVEGKALIDLTLIYHPGRGAMARVPDELTRFALKGVNSDPQTGGYLRENRAAVDTSFSATSGVPSNEIWWDTVSTQLWNRLPSLGWSAPDAPDLGGDVVGYTEQDRESELFYDRGSKTAIFRPFRDRQMTLREISVRLSDGSGATAFPAGYNLLGTTAYTTAPLTTRDMGNLFTTEKYAAFPVPYEYMPRFGRQDIPYYVDINSGNGPFLSGINHLFMDTTNVLSNVFNIIGGEPEATAIKTLIFRTDTPTMYAQYGTYTGIENERPVMYARKTTDINNPPSTYGPEVAAKLAAVNSSDFGKGLKGIQLPPYIGPARVLGIYEKNDFEAAGGHTFQGNRWRMEEAAPPNLLKTDATKQTLFILEDGAKDRTGETGDHTYIIPSNAIDHTRSNYYIAGGNGTEFEDFEYVVECTVFGFAKGWITDNNYVLVRRLNGQGTTNVDNFLTPVEYDDIHMVIPCPAGDSDQLYAAYNRTVYQGDPYASVTGGSADYSIRYGQISIGHQYDMRIPIQQFDANGNFVPETPNPRAFEILASMDFYTTMGTGKMGGLLYPGTPLDIGHTQNTPNAALRMPETNASPAWRILPRTFTEGQASNPLRAKMTYLCQSNASWFEFTGGNYHALRFRIGLQDGTLVDLYASEVDHTVLNTVGIDDADIFDVGADMATTIQNLVDLINTHTKLYKSIRALAEGDNSFELVAVPTGQEGNDLSVSTALVYIVAGTLTYVGEYTAQHLIYPREAIPSNIHPQPFISSAQAPLVGGVDLPLNAGNGTSQVNLTGMTERLPLGALLQDSDFLCENPLNDQASAVVSGPVGPRPIQTLMPMTGAGEEFERFNGAPGQLLALSDGYPCINSFSSYTSTDPGGSRVFRMFRGSGATYMLSGANPGGPIDWVSGTFPPSSQPVLKGGVLACRAMLVRNFPETLTGSPNPSQGDEIQMLVLTYGHIGAGRTQTEGVTLDGILSPAGYGEGYAAADRYRINGKPMFRGFTRQIPDPASVQLATYPDSIRNPE